MKKRYKTYLKLNIMSIFFIIVSFSSLTLAWFAYSGLSKASMDIDVKGWFIELEKNGEKVSNDVVVSLSEIYPGMDTVVEKIKIKNLGDYDASLNYEIVSARILGEEKDNYQTDEKTTSNYVEDVLSHNYPFHININLTKNYILQKEEGVEFEVSVSWPLNSGDDINDSNWGIAAYKFQQEEKEKYNKDNNYQWRSPIKIEIKLSAEQYVEGDNAIDTDYYLGKSLLYDVINQAECVQLSTTCLPTFVIDVNSKKSDEYINVIPDINRLTIKSNYTDYLNNYNLLVSSWNVDNTPLTIKEILRIISKDIDNSFIVRNELSDTIIGNLTYHDRLDTVLEKTINENGYYKFMNNKFNYLTSNTCYWLNTKYSEITSFQYEKIDENTSKISQKDNNQECLIIPIIKIKKETLK